MKKDSALAPLFTWRSAISESDLPPTVRHVALALSLYMNERGGSAHPGPSRLARETGYHLVTVKRALGALEEHGYLNCVTRGGSDRDGTRTANEYVAAFPTPDPPTTTRSAPLPVEQPAHPEHTTTGSPEHTDPESWSRLPVAHDYPNSPENSPENSLGGAVASDPPPTDTPPRPRRAPDPLWDALVEALGHQPATKTERGAWNAARKQLADIDATPDDIHARAAIFRQRYRLATLTPSALVKHWGSLDPTLAENHATPTPPQPPGPRPQPARPRCDTCGGNGWDIDEHGTAIRCPTCNPAKDAAA